MNFYRHYKNKNYRYLGTARHSESLEELVLYEALYPNDLGQVWVRPLAMFHEEIDHQGKTRPRFEKQELKVSEVLNPSAEQLNRVHALAKLVLRDFDPEKFSSRLSGKTVLLHWIEDQGEVVAFKLGYEDSKTVFYSWLGGVRPSHRKLGLARELMQTQHKYCKAHGYKFVTTKTQNQFPAMLSLNMRVGFKITGVEGEDPDTLKIHFRKSLEV